MFGVEQPNPSLEARFSQTKEVADKRHFSPSTEKRVARARSKTAADREDAHVEDTHRGRRGRKKDGEALSRTKSTKEPNDEPSPPLHSPPQLRYVSSDFSARESSFASPKQERLRSKSTSTTAPVPATTLAKLQESEEKVPKPKQSAYSDDDCASETDAFDIGPPPPVNLPPPPVFYISSPPLSPRLRPLASSMISDDTDLTSSNSTLGGGFSPVPTFRNANAHNNWTQQMETDLLDVEIRLRRLKVEEEELTVSVSQKLRHIHDLNLEIERRQNQLELIKQATIGQMALNNDLAPPSLSTPGSRTIGPTQSAVWRSLDPHTPSPASSPSTNSDRRKKTSVSTSTKSSSSTSSKKHGSPKERTASPSDSVETLKRTKSSSSKSSASLASKSTSPPDIPKSLSSTPPSDGSLPKPSAVSRSGAARTKISPKTSDSSVDSKASGTSSTKSTTSNATASSSSKRHQPAEKSPASSPSISKRVVVRDGSKSKSSPKSSRTTSSATGIDVPLASRPKKSPLHQGKSSAAERSHNPSPPPEFMHAVPAFDFEM